MSDAIQLYPLTNVHDALRRAVIADSKKVALTNANFKMHPLRKEVAEEICQKNGTTLSAFLRECTDGLIMDYAGPDVAKKLGVDVNI